MNIVGLIFGLLLIFICTFSLSLRKGVLGRSIERASSAHWLASKKILNTYEHTRYSRISTPKNQQKKAAPQSQKKEPSIKQEQPLSKNQDSKKPSSNPDCAQFNLWPILQEGKQSQRALYELAAQVVRTCYPSLCAQQPHFEVVLLDALLTAARQEQKKSLDATLFALEKLNLPKELRISYYQMLKGTKDGTTPSFLELFVLEKKKVPLCLRHASSTLLTALFGPRVTPLLEKQLQSNLSFKREDLQELLLKQGGNFNEQLLSSFSFSRHSLSTQKKIFTGEEEDVYLKKSLFM